MAYNEEMTNRIREMLAHLPDVEEKKMFRGVAFMVNGKMCVTAGNDEMMCRIDPAIQERLISEKGCRSMIMKGKECKGYVLVHEDVLRSKRELNRWVSLALDFNPFARAAPKKNNRSKKSV